MRHLYHENAILGSRSSYLKTLVQFDKSNNNNRSVLVQFPLKLGDQWIHLKFGLFRKAQKNIFKSNWLQNAMDIIGVIHTKYHLVGNIQCKHLSSLIKIPEIILKFISVCIGFAWPGVW